MTFSEKSDIINTMTRVIIYRPLWHRGEVQASRLRNDEGKMCCLGFACLTAGATEEEIHRKYYPTGVRRLIPGLTMRDDGMLRNTRFSESAAIINDDESITDEEREAKLTELAAANGFEFVFVG